MIGIVHTSLLALLLISWSGFALALTCLPSKSILTAENRDRIFGAVNRDRELIRRAELLLVDGHYALQGAFIKNLTWDCAVESKLAEIAETRCYGNVHPLDGPSVVTVGNWYRPELTIDQHVDVWMDSLSFNASTFTSLQHEVIHQWYGLPFVAFHLSDISTTTACGAYECSARNYTELLCQTSPFISMNETLYTPGNPDVVTTPAPQPSCSIPNSLLTAVHRERIVTKMNEKRAKVLNGTLLLDNGQYAIQAQEMPLLTWDCDLEAKMYTEIAARCSTPDSMPRRNDSSWVAQENYNSIDYYVHELSKTKIESELTFLSNTTIGGVTYGVMDSRVLHDKATKVGCAITQCTFPTFNSPPNGTIIHKPLTILMCSFDVNWQRYPLNKIYEPRNSVTTTTESPPITTSTTAFYNPCTAGWFFYGNACYRYVSGTDRSQAKAEQWCVNQGKKGHLVSIHSIEENNFVKSLILPGDDNVLIGYNNNAWTDASPVNYNNFLTAGGNNACASISGSNNQWKSVDCNGPFKQFICKKNV